jgi:hypothetical protein
MRYSKSLVLTATVAASLGAAGTAQASCHSIGCLSRQLTNVTNQLHRAEAVISGNARVFNAAIKCFKEVPTSTYGDPAGSFGYIFSTGATAIDTTALDVTNPGTLVDGWALYDGCNHKINPNFARARTARAASASTPIAPPASLSLFERPQRLGPR